MQRWLARAIYFPTLWYNLVLGRWLGVRRWWDDIDQQLILMTPIQAQATILLARPHSNPKIYLRPVIQLLYAELQQPAKIEAPA